MIRDARPADARDLADLIAGSFEPALHPYMAYTQHGTAEFLRVQIAHPWAATGRAFFVFEVGGKLLGFAETRRIDQETGFLSYICVAPEARGRGVAKLLIAHWLRSEPHVRAELDVFAHNAVANQLYTGLGFQPESTALWIRRSLPDPRDGLNALDFHVTKACLDLYGFAQLVVQGEQVRGVGLLGASVVRTPDLHSFMDDALLGRIVGAMPDRSEALVVLPAAERDGTIQTRDHDVVLESRRLYACAADVLNALEVHR